MEEAFRGFAEYGVLGLVVLVLLYAIASIFKRYETAQEKRIEEKQEVVKALHGSTGALGDQTKAIAALTEVMKSQATRRRE